MIPWDNCVLWLGYPLQNGVWPDVSKHDNDGVITGAFWEGDSLEFDGIDDFVNCGAHTSLNIVAELTIEAWIYVKAIPSDLGIVGKWTSLSQYLFKVESSDDSLKFATHNGTICSIAQSAANTILVNEWTHVVGVNDGTNLNTYINGILQTGGVVWNGTQSSNVYPLTVGAGTTTTERFEGLISLVRIYNTALTAQQVQESYEQSYRLV